MPTVALDLLTRLSRHLTTERAGRAEPASRHRRLEVPPTLSATLGYDAVGMAARHGRQVMKSLPRVGCVFADGEQWWWIVPAESDIGVDWPPGARYSVDALVPAPPVPRPGRTGRPRLIHCPEDTVPYTHPVLLYIAACRAVGIRPDWSQG